MFESQEIFSIKCMLSECWDENKARFELFEGYEVSTGAVEYGTYHHRIICNISTTTSGISSINTKL